MLIIRNLAGGEGRRNTCSLASARSFTLMELLVVVAIIFILAALLVPSLQSALQMSRRVTCTNNQKLLYQGCMLYVQDYRGWMPPTIYNAQHIGYINDYANVSCDNFDKYMSPKYGIYYSSPAMRKPAGGFFFCPSLYLHASESPVWSGSVEGDYYYSNYMQTSNSNKVDPHGGCWNAKNDDGTYSPFRKLNMIKDGTVLLGEANYCDTALLQPTVNINRCLSLLVAYRNKLPETLYAPAWNLHSSFANFLFKDGHVGAYSWGDNFDTDYVPIR